jgi:glycosyltransferase involved in cell wall biosynthesis
VDPAAEKKSRGWPQRLILFAGRLVGEKGVFVLLDAYRQLSQSLDDVGLLFVGDGPAHREMVAFCREASLPAVFFGGEQDYDRMPLFYALAEVLVLPTFSDAYGYVVVEAFACGVPAIVSNVAGVCDDFIRDGETGFAVEPGDAAELARRIRQVLQEDGLRARMSANCRRMVEGYSPEACAEALLAAVSRAPAQTTGLVAPARGSR